MAISWGTQLPRSTGRRDTEIFPPRAHAARDSARSACPEAWKVRILRETAWIDQEQMGEMDQKLDVDSMSSYG